MNSRDGDELDDLLKAHPWDHLEGPYGPTPQIPALIKELTSPDAPSRLRALELLRELSTHQGSIYETTAYAVPPLLWILKQRIPEQASVMNLLITFGCGKGFFTVHQQMAIVRDKYRPEDLASNIMEESKLSSHIQKSLREGIPLFIELVNDSDVEIRINAARLLSLFPDDARCRAELEFLAGSDPSADIRSRA